MESAALALLLAAAAVLRVRALDISQCIAPLGMESGLIPDADISASSCYNDGNVAPQNGRLNQDIKGGAWCPRSQISPESAEWLQVELHGVHVLTAVGTQGRFGNGQGQEFAEAFVLEYWRPRLGKWVRYRGHHGQEVLPGNINTYLEVKTQLAPAVWASRVRFLPHSSHRRTVCMRVELYGCLWNAGIVSYSMPAGDSRSNGVELSDATYDGSWSSGQLRDGLGQLVDGEFGGDEIREAARVSPWVGWRNESRAAVPTARREDPLYVAVAVGVLTALGILVGVAVFLLVHRHRHRKCFTSPAGKAALSAQRRALDDYSGCGSTSGGGEGKAAAGAGDGKADEYQEPYQPLAGAPCFSYSSVLLQMTRLHSAASTLPLEDSCNYEYAVPEPSAAPLLARRRDSPPADRACGGSGSGSSSGSVSCSGSAEDSECGGEVEALRRRIEEGDVPELPRHRLRMISKLAEGAFGTVYVAEADGVPEYEGGVSADKQLVAVKFLSQDASRDERCAFERDVRILAALAHPCLARVVGACRGAGAPLAVVLEYLPGGDLCAHLRSAAPPPLAALLHVALQLAAGMRYLEALNFVHRDLAARNCLVGAHYRIKIGDFGTDNEAYARDYVSVGGRVVPLRWAAPEAALEGRHSTRADVWSFGVTLHEVFSLCRRRPFERLGDEAVARALAAGAAPAERAPPCPRDVFRLMRGCWRREPRDRPAFRDAHAFLQRRRAPPASYSPTGAS